MAERAQVPQDVAADVGALLAQFTAAQDDGEGVGVQEQDLDPGAVRGGGPDAAEEAFGVLGAEQVGEGVEDFDVRRRAVDLGAEPLVVEPGVFADPALLGAGDQRADHEDGDDDADDVGAEVEGEILAVVAHALGGPEQQPGAGGEQEQHREALRAAWGA